MSSKVMITYKRKRVTSRGDTADETIRDSSSAASSDVAASSFPTKFEAHAENNVKNEDNFPTSTMQHGVCMSMQQNIKEELANQSTCKSEKGEKKLHICESIPRKEQPEICCATNLSNAEAQIKKLQSNDDTNSRIPVSSSVCDPMHIDGVINGTEYSNTSALAEINYHQAPKNPCRSDQCENRFSPLLTFRRRVKKKNSSDELAEENCSPDNKKQCSTLTCSRPSSPPDATDLLKHTGGRYSDTEDKEDTVGRNSGPSMQAEKSHEQESLQVMKSSVQHMFPSQITEVVNQDDVTPVSKLTNGLEVHEQDGRLEDLSKTSPGTIEVPNVINVKVKGHANGHASSPESQRQEINVSWLRPTNKSAAEDLIESQGSTKNVPVIVLDDDSDEKGKELENSEALDQGAQNKNKSGFSLGKIDLNCAELQQERHIHLGDSSTQWLPDQNQYGNAQKQISQPIERMFFTKEKDTMHGKQQQHEGSSTLPTLYPNCFDLTPQWNTGGLKAPRSFPSELKFRIIDKVPEFNLDLSLDSFRGSSVSSRRSNKFSLGGTSSVSHKLEKLGTSSYKRRSAPWSEEELDFLWIGVRRYGLNNWNAMLRDTRLRFSNSRMPDDLAKQWDKEQKKLLGSDLLQSIRTSGLGPAPPPHVAEDYLGSGSCSGCSKSPFLAAQTDLSLGDVYLQNAHGPERGEHHLPSLGMLNNLHGIDSAPRNLSLGGFPGASSSCGRSTSRRRRASKFHKSYYEKSPWFQEPSGRWPQLLPIVNQQPINNGLPQWLTKDAEAGTSRVNPEMWPSMAPAPGHSAADPPSESLRGTSLFADDVKPDALLKRTMRRNTDWRSFSKRLFQTGDALEDLNEGPAAIAGRNASDTGASSEETVSDS